MLRQVRVGLIDGAVDNSIANSVDGVFGGKPLISMSAGHGSQIARSVLAQCPSARLVVANVFDQGREANLDAVLVALSWLAKQRVQVINMSFGMAVPSSRFAQACRDAAQSGTVLVASAPARGTPVFPAAFEDCIAVTGDARCAPGEVSWLATPAADFGTHPMCEPGRPEFGGGASIACARMSGILARLLAAGANADSLRARLRQLAIYTGPERRYA